MIIHAVLFAGTRRARRAGDRARHVRSRAKQLLAKRRLAAARRRGNQNQQRRRIFFILASGFWLLVPVFHSTFCTCSRNLSNSVFSVTTSREITASFAFEPIVLISRFISCARKSNVRPTGSRD